MKDYIKLIISVAITLIIGYIGSIFTSSSVNSWYTTLAKPAFNPPNWLFAPVWTALFVLIGISFYLVWKNNFGNTAYVTIGIFIIQLLLNLLWSFLFFYSRNLFLSFIEILVLWCVILANIIIFYRISKPAGILLIPYILWVSFASFLNYSIYILNKA